jgi:hypothetical protein
LFDDHVGCIHFSTLTCGFAAVAEDGPDTVPAMFPLDIVTVNVLAADFTLELPDPKSQDAKVLAEHTT